MSLKSKIAALVETSSWHALPNIVRTNSLTIKIMWALCFLVALGYGSYTVTLMVVDFLSYQVLVTIDTVQDFNRDFPAVTICNLNAFDFSNNQTKVSVENYLYQQLQVRGNILGYNDGQQVDRDLCNKSIKNIVRFVPGYFNYSYTIDKMLISCYYDDKECKKYDDFTMSTSPLYGNCISFNLGKNLTKQNVPVKKSKRPGLINGLQLELFIGAPEYQPCWALNVGALVVVHDKQVSPLFAEDGLKVAPGFETSIIIEVAKNSKLSLPYSDCVTDVNSIDGYDSDNYRSIFKTMGVYSQQWCILNCANVKAGLDNQATCQPIANVSKLLYNICLADRQNLSNYYGECIDGCPTACETTTLNVKTSAAVYPTLARLNKYLNDSNILSRFPYSNVSRSQLQSSILSINAFYSSSSYHQITETPATSIPDLLANLGGQMGLMLGCSMLSFIEIIEIILEICFYVLAKGKAKVANHPDDETTKEPL